MKYIYYVYFTFSNGHGYREVTMKKEITTIKQIEDISNGIVVSSTPEAEGNIIISNFILLRKEQ